jgi:hypothetical protein
MSLTVKDGNNTPRELETIFGTGTNLVPVHSITGSISAELSNDNIDKITGSIDATTAEVAKLTALSSSAGFKVTGSVTLDDYAALSGTISSSAAVTTAEVAKLTALSSSAGYKISGSVSLYEYSALSGTISSSAYNSTNILSGTISSSAATTTAEIAKLTALSGSNGFKISGSISLNEYTELSGNIAAITTEVAKLTALSSSLGLRTYTKYASSTTSNIPTLANAKIGNDIGQNSGRLGYIISNQSDASLYIGIDNLKANLPSMATIILFAGETYESSPQNAQMKFAVKLDASATTGTYSILETF